MTNLLIIAVVIAIGIFMFKFFYSFFEKVHSRYDEHYQKGFCEKCLKETLPVSCGDISAYYFIGTTLAFIGDRCDICNSYTAEHRKIFFWYYD